MQSINLDVHRIMHFILFSLRIIRGSRNGRNYAARYYDLVEPCALELVGHRTCSKFCLPRLFLYFGQLTLHEGMASSQQDIEQLLTCVLVEFKLTLNRDTATEP